MNEVRIDGIEQNLRRMAAQNKNLSKKVLTKGAEYIESELKKNTPVGANDINEHLKDNTTISNIDSNGEIKIGFKKEVNWRVHFVELGTIYQKPQGFIQQTQAQTKNRFFEIVQDEIKKELNL